MKKHPQPLKSKSKIFVLNIIVFLLSLEGIWCDLMTYFIKYVSSELPAILYCTVLYYTILYCTVLPHKYKIKLYQSQHLFCLYGLVPTPVSWPQVCLHISHPQVLLLRIFLPAAGRSQSD